MSVRPASPISSTADWGMNFVGKASIAGDASSTTRSCGEEMAKKEVEQTQSNGSRDKFLKGGG
jgi:hypothetical protein